MKTSFPFHRIALFLFATALTTTATDLKISYALGQIPEVQSTPIDILQSRLYQSNRSSTARALKTAYDLIQSQKFSEAREIALPLRSDTQFSDYANWISALSDRGMAENSYVSHQYSAALTSVNRSIQGFHLIETLNPYSPLIKQVPKEIGISEVVRGNILSLSGQWAAAVATFERAFLRLQLATALDELSITAISNYATACKKVTAKKRGSYQLCDPWIGKFLDTFAPHSEEIKTLAAQFPGVENRPRPTSQAPKASLNYKAPDLDQQAFDQAFQLVLKEKYGSAIDALRKFQDDFPRSGHRFRARYWLAACLERDGSKDKAKPIFEDLEKENPITYYGMLSGISLGHQPAQVSDGSIPAASASDPYLSPLETFRLKRAQQLISAQAHELASIELKELRARDTLSNSYLYYLATLNFEARNYGNTFSILGALNFRGFSSALSNHAIQMIFPLVHLNLIEKFSAESSLDPILVLSLIKQESAFEKTALSNVGAVGVMQIMPSTAIEIETVTRVGLNDLQTNLRIGTKYYRKLLTRYNGNIALSLAAYNAGPHAVDRWLRDFPSKRGLLEFVDFIPYRETREYVASIIRNYLWYSRKLTGDSAKGLGYFWNVYGPPEKPAALHSTPQLPTSD